MALLLPIEKSDGTIVNFWRVDVNSLSLIVSGGNITGAVRLSGYISQSAATSGKSISSDVEISDFTQSECEDILKSVGKSNIERKIEDIIRLRPEWESATRVNE